MWTPTQKQVQKDKVSSKILSACWNMDGSIMAVGLQNGMITVRTNKSEEICRIDRTAPVWCLTFAMGIVSNSGNGGKAGPGSSTIDTEVLMVGCWDKTVSSYRIVPSASTSNTTNANANGRGNAIKASERNVKFYPTSISITGGINSKNSFMVSNFKQYTYIYNIYFYFRILTLYI